MADIATCYTGRSDDGAYYALAVPDDWQGDLVVHAHGGPDLGADSDPARSLEDLERWAVMVQEGYAWAGSSYRRGGYGVRMAVADTEQVREIFVGEFGEPRTTFAHGQSWGGNVAARLVELNGDSYDGALLTNGVLAGGSRGYDYRVDLRVVYQYYCQNHPRPSEPQYPLWMGLRPGSTLTSYGSPLPTAGVHRLPVGARGSHAAPAANLDDILAVTRIPERTLESHLRFATFTFRDIVQRLDGRNPFNNRAVRYSGSHDDAALNAGVERFSADPAARRDLSWDSDLTGDVDLPVLTVHAIDDPTAFVEHESAYRASLRRAGSAGHLVQVFTRETEHSQLSNAEYAAAIAALSTWVQTGARADSRRRRGRMSHRRCDLRHRLLRRPRLHARELRDAGGAATGWRAVAGHHDRPGRRMGAAAGTDRHRALTTQPVSASRAASARPASVSRGTARPTTSSVIRVAGPDTDSASRLGASGSATATQRTPTSCSPSSIA